MAKRAEWSSCKTLAIVTAAAAIGVGWVGQQYTPLLLMRNSTRTCLPPGFVAAGPEPVEPLAAVVLDDFNRDGAVLIRGGLRWAKTSIAACSTRSCDAADPKLFAESLR